MATPLFFVFDGVDGSGKTTQIQRFRAWLDERGHEVVLCRDPGTSGLGERVRDLLLNSTDLEIGFRAEMLLYMAARAQLVEEIIEPSLRAGKSVISDRFLLANVVYQGYGGGLDADLVWQVGEVATGGLAPTLNFVLDLDPAVAAQRRRDTVPDRLESRSQAYFDTVRNGFLAEAARWPDRIEVIDASQTPDEVAQSICRVATTWLDGQEQKS